MSEQRRRRRPQYTEAIQSDTPKVDVSLSHNQEYKNTPQTVFPTNGLIIAGWIVSACSMLISLFGIVGMIGMILSAVGYFQAKQEGSPSFFGACGFFMGLGNVISTVGRMMMI